MDIKFFKRWYSAEEAINILNKYFSVSSFTLNDVMNLFLENELTLAVSCNITKTNYEDCDFGFLTLRGEQKRVIIDLFDKEQYPPKESFILNDGFAEVDFIANGDELSFIASGYFAIPPYEAYFSKESDKYYLYFNEIEFIDTDDFISEPIEIESTFHILIHDRDLNHIGTELSNIFIHNKELLRLIAVLEDRNKSSQAFLDTQLNGNNASPTLNRIELDQAKTRIKELEAEIEYLKQTHVPPHSSSIAGEYSGEIPPATDRDKLRDFIELIANDDFIENDRLISYSRIHTKLEHKYKGKRKITAKNTIGKYINEVQ